MKSVDEFFVRPIGGMRAVFFGDDESGATGSASRVIRGVLSSGFTVAGVVGQVGTEYDAVGHDDRA